MSMKSLAAALVALVLSFCAAPVHAEIGTIDAVPASTLLLPYFEVDLGDPGGVTTVFSVNNASASAALANVTIWTDWGVPSFGFQIYLTGYDTQIVDLRDVFNGILPVSADAGADPGDQRTHKGPLSQDINFPGSVGPCGSPSTVYGQPDPTLPLKVQNLQRVHRGLSSSIDNLCWGASYGDAIARGYVTVDSVTTCALLTPADAGYFATTSDDRNILWGDFTLLDPAQQSAQTATLVHVESCSSPTVGNGAGLCPFVPGDYTFYGRYVAATAEDHREPLPTTFASRYRVKNQRKGTDLLVWRDTKASPTGANGRRTCGVKPAWFPLSQTDVVAFDQTENPSDLCFLPDNVSPVIGGSQVCFPLATQRIHVSGGNTLATDMGVPFKRGWLYLNLNQTLAVSDPFPGLAQAWVTTLHPDGRQLSGIVHGLPLDNASSANPGGVLLIP
jgi:hypothetical protein